MNVLVRHVHGSWTTAFVQGRHRYLVPTLPERGRWGGGPVASSRHPAADRDDLLLVHVTHFNDLMWDDVLDRALEMHADRGRRPVAAGPTTRR